MLSHPQKNSANWYWQTWENSSYLSCELLEFWQHGFFTKEFYPRTPEELVKILDTQASVYRVKQVHGNKVLNPVEIDQYQQNPQGDTLFPLADGVISTQEKQAVWVASADCTPVLIGDRKTKQVSAIHAGWRGTAKRIVPEGINIFLERGSELKDLVIALGPAISGKVYQVSEDVAIEVGVSLKNIDTSQSILDALHSMSNSPLNHDDEEGKVRLDVRTINWLQLQEMGFHDEQIAIAPYCTYQQPEYFFSYRRTQEKKVQWSGIVSK